jgi:hypothetical protein
MLLRIRLHTCVSAFNVQHGSARNPELSLLGTGISQDQLHVSEVDCVALKLAEKALPEIAVKPIDQVTAIFGKQGDVLQFDIRQSEAQLQLRQSVNVQGLGPAYAPNSLALALERSEFLRKSLQESSCQFHAVVASVKHEHKRLFTRTGG